MRGMGRLGSYSDFAGDFCPSGMNGTALAGGMGADCQEGYYKLKILGFDTGQCVPNLSTAANAAAGGVTGSVASGVASSPATAAAAQSAAANAIGTKIVNFYKSNPTMAIGLTVVVGGLLIYGTMSFLRGR